MCRMALIHLLLCSMFAVASLSATLPALYESRAIIQPGAGVRESEKQSECMKFILDHLPDMDKNVLSKEQLQLNVDLALAARAAHKWSRAVPWEIFLNFVLPHANLDEQRDDWRTVMVKHLAPMVSEAMVQSLSQAVHLINSRAWAIWGIKFKAGQTPEILSPTQVIEHGYASCTGLSIFLVDALRAVGIPARVTGTPDWRRKPRSIEGGADAYGDEINNHNWVEFWDDNEWSFIGAAEDDPNHFNRTWFFPEPAKHQLPGSPMHAIYSVSYVPTEHNVTYPLIWDEAFLVHAYDVTLNYINAADDDDGGEVMDMEALEVVE